MKILRIIYDWPNPWQGLAAHPYEVTLSQVKKGDKVSIMCGNWPNSGGPVPIDGVDIDAIYREPFPGTIFFTSSVILFYKYLLWRMKNKVDIIHSHGHFAIWIYLYRLILQKYFPWAKELKTPLVVHYHNVPQGRKESLEKRGVEMSNKTKFVSNPLEIKSAEWAAKTAAANIFVSDQNLVEAKKFLKVNPLRCFVVETGVNIDLFKSVSAEEKNKSRKDMGLDQYDIVVLNHGVLNERKNIHHLVMALKDLPSNYKLLLVGPSEPHYHNKLKEMIKNNGFANRIIWVGYTPYPHVPIAYQVSDVFVLPSSYEGLPKAVMQGLACSIPCIVSGFKLSTEISGLEYLDEVSPENIAEKVIRVIENPPSVDVNKVIELYSWDVRVKKIDEIYDFAKTNYLI